MLRNDLDVVDESVKRVGEILQKRRKELGWSLRELARRADTAPGYIARIEKGKAEPSWAMVCSLCQELGIRIELVKVGI